MLVADVVALEWEVLRWRHLESTLVRVCQHEALEEFLCDQLGYDVYAEDFVDDLASTLKDNLPRDQADTAEQLAGACAGNNSVAVDKVNQILAKLHVDTDDILDRAQAHKAKELRKSTFGVSPTSSNLWMRFLPARV